MRLLIMLLLTALALTVWADGFTSYGVSTFNGIWETDQVAVIDLAPGGVTLDMYIGIDRIPRGQTITYVLPFWQKPEGFTMGAMSGDDFRAQYLSSHEQTPKAQAIFEREIRRANRTATGELPDAYLTAGTLIYAPLAPFGTIRLILFSTFGKHGYHLSPYASTTLPAGSAELYHLSTDEDLQALVAKSGLPERYAAVLRRYHTPYYAIMRLHGPTKAPDKNALTSQGLHFHFTHRTTGDAYTYTYPLGTGGAWANPIVCTEIYATCPSGYYLTARAPTLGKMGTSLDLENRVLSFQDPIKEGKLSDLHLLPTITATYLPPMRYPTAWHRAYFNSNPTDDITIRLARRPFDPLFSLISAWRDSNTVVLPFILLGYVGSLLFAVHTTVRKACLTIGEPAALWKYGGRFMLFSIGCAIVPFVGWILWLALLPRADDKLPRGTIVRATLQSILCYALLFPVWYGVAWLMDCIVKG